MGKKAKMYFLTEQELERFDHMITALGQAYWSLVRQRSVKIDFEETNTKKITKNEEDFYQLHLELNTQIENDEQF